jgi:carbamoyl-phosphate synthase large subunit
MTGAGAPGGAGIIKALMQETSFHLITADADERASGRYLSKVFYKIPPASSPDFINRILTICQIEKIDVILPLVTKELFLFSKHKALWNKNGIKVIVSDILDLEIANNKSALYKHLQQHQIAIPRFKAIFTVAEFRSACSELGYPDKPVFIKPALSNGSRGARILDHNINDFDLFFQEKPTHLYTNLDQIEKMMGSRPIPEMLVTEYLPGEEYTVDTIVEEGIPRIILPRLRTKMMGGITVQGQFLQNEAIIEYSRSILMSMKLHGPIGLQVKKSAEGEFKILEINPRIQGTSVSALGVGVNLPVLAIRQEFEKINFDEIKIKWGTKFSRYFSEVFYE